MHRSSKVFVAGHRGLAGSAICRALQRRGFEQLVVRTHEELDLEDAHATARFFEAERPDVVFMAAAMVGGILANNTYPVEFLANNLQLELNVIRAAFAAGTSRLIFLGSSCIYPRDCPQPIKEEYLLTGPLEATNRPYAIAKIAGIELCWAFNRQHGTRFLSAMPTNLYGPGDHYDPDRSHVLPALIRKMHEAKVSRAHEVVLWGSGTPRREFLFSDDLGDALVFLASLPEEKFSAITAADVCPIINVGTGEDQTIRELATIVAEVVDYEGRFVYDPTKPDGTPRKLMDGSRMRALGWTPTVDLHTGIRRAYDDFLARYA